MHPTARRTPARLLGLAAALSLTPLGCLAAGEVPADSGLFTSRIVTNASSTNRGNFLYFNQWETLTLVNQDKREIEIKAEKGSGNNSSQVFEAVLPAGKYQLVQMLSPKLAGRVTGDLKGVIGEFEVKPQTVTSLGTLIYQPTGSQGYTILCDGFDAPQIERVRLSYPALHQAMADHAPVRPCLSNEVAARSNQAQQGRTLVMSNSGMTAVVGTLTVGLIQSLIQKASATEAIQAWKDEQDPQKRLAMARSSTYAFNAARMLESGDVLAGSNLGQVLARDSEGRWERLDTGDTREITALLATDRQRFMVGGEEGLLMQTSDAGKTWQALSAPTHGLIVNLARQGQRVYLLAVEGLDAVLYATDDLKSGTWQELRREAGSRSDKPEAMGWIRLASMAASGWIVGERYVMVTANGFVNSMDLKDGSWTRSKTSFEEPRQVTALRDGTLVAYSRNKVYVSRDQGATWTKDEQGCMKMITVAYGYQGQAYNVCGQGAFVFSTAIMQRGGEGGRWTTISDETPTPASALFASEYNDTLLFMNPEGLIYGRAAGAKEWTLERKPL
ncbi:WD40/YVTN/BNR-like repeat-containing protein [Roseateles flavus]|uniref:YCF48-related protein n=1 Tax=Roseateles flavus TaxID=3149041 RepID=A0ABV0G8L4_9BURK